MTSNVMTARSFFSSTPSISKVPYHLMVQCHQLTPHAARIGVHPHGFHILQLISSGLVAHAPRGYRHWTYPFQPATTSGLRNASVEPVGGGNPSRCKLTGVTVHGSQQKGPLLRREGFDKNPMSALKGARGTLTRSLIRGVGTYQLPHLPLPPRGWEHR